MTKEQKNKRIIGLVIILVLVGVLYYTKTSKQSTLPENESTDGAQVEDTNSDVISDAQSEEVSTTNTSPSSTKDNAKFNELLESGNKAMYNKDYAGAIRLFNQALAIEDADFIYARLHSVYAAMGDKVQAVKMIDQAIAKNQLFTEYWVTKLVYLDDKTDTSFAELKQIYTDGLGKVDSRTKPNLVTTFARIAESNGMKDEAIAAWQKAMELYPANKAIYQAEIDRLKSL